MSSSVSDNRERSRYDIRVDDQPVGYTEYYLHNGVAAFIHTEIDHAHEGQGLASELVGSALSDARRRGLKVEPFCSFVRGYIARNPDYRDLVPVDEWPRFGLS